MLGSLLLLLDGYLLSSLVCFFAVVVEVIDWFSKGTYRGFYVKFVMVFCVFVSFSFTFLLYMIASFLMFSDLKHECSIYYSFGSK